MASVHPDDVSETPLADRGESFGVLDALLGVSPFVLLVGMLSGIAAALVVWPVAARVGTPRDHSIGTTRRTSGAR